MVTRNTARTSTMFTEAQHHEEVGLETGSRHTSEWRFAAGLIDRRARPPATSVGAAGAATADLCRMCHPRAHLPGTRGTAGTGAEGPDGCAEQWLRCRTEGPTRWVAHHDGAPVNNRFTPTVRTNSRFETAVFVNNRVMTEPS